ncbi:MAG: HEAT repeat domain-containing protein [Gemmatimonadaceae bacterium]
MTDTDEFVEPPFPAALVSDLMRAFAKAVRAHQLYLPNNPMHARAMDAVKSAFRVVWDEAASITIQVSETDLRWLGRVVLEEEGRTSDSLPWMFYKDGIRELGFRKGFEDEELLILLMLMQRARLASADDDDLLTLLWEHDFSLLQYKYIDLAMDSGAPLDSIRGEEVEKIVAPGDVEAEAQLVASSSITRMDEYDSTLYFLDETEIDYLRDEIRKDFGNDLRILVVASLLDTYEQESDPNVREEIASILDGMFLLMLSLTQFRVAAYIVREAAVSADRADEILLDQRQRLMQLSDRLSDTESLSQLLQALEETPLRPPQTELHELFGQLQPQALETILSWIGRTRNAELRALLEAAASKLAASHTAELVRLISSEDEVVAFEAIGRAGAMKASAAVFALAGIISHGSPEMRLGGVAALSDIGSPGALQVLERSLQDDDIDIRIAAVKVLGSRRHRAALKGIEGHLRSRALRDSSLAEKMAFFESFGALSGDEGVDLLGDILNSRSILGRREDGEFRACAAMALGKIGTDMAMKALQRALGDRDVIVRNAASRAVRG